MYQNTLRSIKVALLSATLCGLAASAAADNFPAPDMGKFLATGGVKQLEGAGGGGITPWALITGYGSEDSYGINAHITQVGTQDYRLKTYGVAVGFADKLEMSLSKQEFSGSLAPLDQLNIQQDIVGIKLKLTGDAVFDQDKLLPQIAVGVMLKRNNGIAGLGALGVSNVRQLGASNDTGVDYYVSATKLYLDQSLLLSATLRLTKANQMGILGFGGDKSNHYQAMFEGSAAYLIHRKLVAGVEYRMKPRNLGIDNEKDFSDIFLAYFPNKNFSVTAAYANLGDITIFNPKNQRGWYLSLQVGN
ncbi:DUF3034 family protein [Undibacterium sp. Rencai35W]|uniref:DUF3034 family protein n=1 Tax=Undibacterium sp. Rencai35W TaxID=3413046 RepID=UPI003BEF82F8